MRPHVLALRGEIQCFADAREGIVVGDTAGVARINGSPQPREFRLVLLFLALQRPQRGPDHFAWRSRSVRSQPSSG